MRLLRSDVFLHALPSLLLLLLWCGCTAEEVLVREVIVEVEKEVLVPDPIEVPVYTPAGKVWVDSFVQPASVNGIDILWVIDTSGSMDDHDQALLQGIGAMLNALPPIGWRLAMIPAMPSLARTVQQFPLVPGDDEADAATMYSLMPRGPKEEGFAAAHDYITLNPYSATWMRPDAALLIVFVSDEEEQSRAPWLANVGNFITWYQGYRTTVYLSAIVHPLNGSPECEPADNDIGRRYIEATDLVEGVVIDICDEDWSAGVAAASSMVEPIDELFLSYVPMSGTIRVFIDSQPDFAWNYDPLANRIVFNVMPSASSLVEVAYIVDPTQ